MLSWKLWQALRNPPYRHPLMRRARADLSWLTNLWDRALPFYLYVILLGGGYLMWRITPHTFGFVFLLILLIPMLATMLILISPLLFPLVLIGVGALWAGNISERVVEQQEIGIYDLLCVLPGGRWAANWATACGSIHQGGIFETGWLVLRGVLALGLMLLVMLFLVGAGQVASSEAGVANFGGFTLDMVAVLVAYALHHIQSMVLSPLVGLLVPTVARSRVEARLGGAGLYIGIQVGSYLLGGLLFYGVPLLTGGAGWATRSLTPYLIALFALREAIIWRLWVLLLRRLNLTAAEKDHLWLLSRIAS